MKNKDKQDVHNILTNMSEAERLAYMMELHYRLPYVCGPRHYDPNKKFATYLQDTKDFFILGFDDGDTDRATYFLAIDSEIRGVDSYNDIQSFPLGMIVRELKLRNLI